MGFDPKEILSVLDDCAKTFAFPMLDNGYVYLARARLSLYRSSTDWAFVFEIFGFNPRSGLPDTSVQTFASRPVNRDQPSNYVSHSAFEAYMQANPHNEWHSIFPIDPGPWQDPDSVEVVSSFACEITFRGQFTGVLPKPEDYGLHGIILESPSEVHVYELCRFLAETTGDILMATPDERRFNVASDMNETLILDMWHHPDLANLELPSESETFQQLAKVLSEGDISLYQPSKPPNTHWSNWPLGGTL